MYRRDTLPKVEDLVKGRVYKIYSRNLSYGVWDGEKGFIGIRLKWHDRFLATEYHYDVSERHGTVSDAKDLGIDIPDSILVVERFDTIDETTERPVSFDEPVKKGGRGWYFKDTGESDQSIRAVSKANKELFDFLDKIEDENI